MPMTMSALLRFVQRLGLTTQTSTTFALMTINGFAREHFLL